MYIQRATGAVPYALLFSSHERHEYMMTKAKILLHTFNTSNHVP